MSELHDEFQNLSAVLENLQPDAPVSQRPVLRLVSAHLRLLAQLFDTRDGVAQLAPLPGAGPARAPAFTGRASEVGHVRQ